MLGITITFCSLLVFPLLRVTFKNELARFYWRGFWVFPVLIAGFAGGQQILWLAGIESQASAVFYLSGLTVAYVVFVVFAWIRLSLVSLYGVFQRYFNGHEKQSVIAQD